MVSNPTWSVGGQVSVMSHKGKSKIGDSHSTLGGKRAQTLALVDLTMVESKLVKLNLNKREVRA